MLALLRDQLHAASCVGFAGGWIGASWLRLEGLWGAGWEVRHQLLTSRGRTVNHLSWLQLRMAVYFSNCGGVCDSEG